MVDNAKPSVDPSNSGDMVGMMAQVFQKFLQSQVNDMLPGRVIAFDRVTNRAQVQFMIVIVTTEGQTVRRAPVASVPVFQIGGGNYILNYNLLPGDLGWIKATDRDISLFLQSYEESPPNTYRLHDFGDAVFFPDVMTGYTISSEDQSEGAAVLQTKDGTQRISIWSDRVKITSDQEIILDAPLTRITGDLVSGEDTGGAGTMTFSGEIQVSGDVIASYADEDISLKDHVHINAGGTGDSGPPKPV